MLYTTAMNLVITLPQIKQLVQHGTSTDYFFFFMERKPNIIMDGIFTKLAISTSFFTMNGVFLSVEFHEKIPSSLPTRFTPFSYETPKIYPKQDCKYYIYFEPYSIENRYNTECIIQLEEMILQMYSATNISSDNVSQFPGEMPYMKQVEPRMKTRSIPDAKRKESFTKTPVYSLKTQLHGGAFKIHREDYTKTPILNRYILKISGVWESTHSYGITYKCIPDYQGFSEETVKHSATHVDVQSVLSENHPFTRVGVLDGLSP